jgi:dTDP-4-dehydrorhamnose 3,5-epimerase-like enzyme
MRMRDLKSRTMFGADVLRYDFGAISDARGNLCPLDFDRLPFLPSHLFFIFDVPVGSQRGGHAHRTNEQLLICLSGKIAVSIRHRGREEELLLNRPGQGLYLRPNVWSSQTYTTADAKLLVLTSGKYDPSGYTTRPTESA